jgi:hypothetical protein
LINGAGLSEKIRAEGLAGQPDSVKLIGVYYPTNTLTEILIKGYSAPSPFSKAFVLKRYGSVSDAKTGFQTYREMAKKESKAWFNSSAPATKTIIDRYTEAALNTNANASIKAGETAMLGTLFDDDTVHASCWLVSLKWPGDRSQTDMLFTKSVASIVFGKDQVEVAVFYPFRDLASITITNQKLMTWIRRIRKQNPGN